MSLQPGTSVSDVSVTPPRAAAVEQHFAALQDTHRLAIHMAEERFEPFYSQTTIEKLNHFPADSIDDALRRGRPRLFSLSLLPSRASGISMLPYEVKPSQMNSYGYLFDLTQQAKSSPRVVRVSPTNISSLEDVDGKNFNFEDLALAADSYRDQTHRNFTEQLCDFYRDIADFREPLIRVDLQNSFRNPHERHNQKQRWRDTICKAVGKRGAELTNQQLDMLGQYYEKHPALFADPVGAWDNGIATHNEILAACHQSHISAIVVPLYHNPSDNLSKPLCDAVARFQGSVAGLKHMEKGINIPVMVYDVNAITGSKNMLYVGQGVEELRKAGEDALSHIGQQDMMLLERTNRRDYHQLHSMAKRYFNKDIRFGVGTGASQAL